MRFAVIDLGTNSCRLLIGEPREHSITCIYNDLQTTRLGQGLTDTGRISELALYRTISAINDFRQKINEYGVSSYRAIATSAVREAANREDFVRMVKDKCNLDIDVISGEEEAWLSYLGVKKGLNLKTPLVADLGGGTTEFMRDDFMISLPVGAVRATEANMSAYDITEILSPLIRQKEKLQDNPLVFVGGTATTLAAIKLSLQVYERNLVHGQVLKRKEILDIYTKLERMSLSERKLLPGLQPERADIITKGILTVLLIMDILQKEEIIVSESDLMEGVIWELQGKN